jgi:hypothetical protein
MTDYTEGYTDLPREDTAGPWHVGVQAEGQAWAAAWQGVHSTGWVQTGGAQTVVNLLPVDFSRTEAQVLAIDNPVILCGSAAQAQAAAVQVAAGASVILGGSWLPVGFDRPILNGDELWAVATSSSLSRVSVIASRRHDPS